MASSHGFARGGRMLQDASGWGTAYCWTWKSMDRLACAEWGPAWSWTTCCWKPWEQVGNFNSNISRSCTQRDSTSPGPFLILKACQGQGIWPHALKILLDLQRQGVRAASCQQRHAVSVIAASESTCGLAGLTWHGKEVACCGLRVWSLTTAWGTPWRREANPAMDGGMHLGSPSWLNQMECFGWKKANSFTCKDSGAEIDLAEVQRDAFSWSNTANSFRYNSGWTSALNLMDEARTPKIPQRSTEALWHHRLWFSFKHAVQGEGQTNAIAFVHQQCCNCCNGDVRSMARIFRFVPAHVLRRSWTGHCFTLFYHQQPCCNQLLHTSYRCFSRAALLMHKFGWWGSGAGGQKWGHALLMAHDHNSIVVRNAALSACERARRWERTLLIC